MDKEIKTVDFVNESAENYENEKRQQLNDELGYKLNKSREDIQNKVKRRKLVVTAGCIALLTTGTVFGLVKSNEYNNKSINIIKREATIHAGKYEQDGKIVNPKLPHDCKIGDKNIGSVYERIKKYALDNGYSLEQAEYLAKKYQELNDDEISLSLFEENLDEFENGRNNNHKK